MKINEYELVMEKVADFPADREMTGPEEVADFLKGALNLTKKTKEHFVTLAVNTKGAVIGVNDTSVGTLNKTPVHPRDVFQFALLSNAYGVILAHNHPSGDITPSEGDIITTKRLVEAGDIVGIKVLDHVIIGDNGFTSMKLCDYMD